MIKSLCFLTMLFFIVLFNCCNHFDVQNDEQLNDTWIEEVNHQDTIIININKSTGELLLNRGFEIRNGYRLPKWGAGFYSYSFSGDSISLIYGLSDCMCQNHYLFKVDIRQKSFVIGNFFKEHPADPDPLIFVQK